MPLYPKQPDKRPYYEQAQSDPLLIARTSLDRLKAQSGQTYDDLRLAHQKKPADAPASADATRPIYEYVLPYSALSATEQTVSDGVQSPLTPTTLTIVGSAPEVSGDVVIYGKNGQGKTMSERIPANGDSSVMGAKVFASIDRITLPRLSPKGENEQVAVGIAPPLSQMG